MALPELFKVTKKRYVDATGSRCKKNAPGAIEKTERLADWYADIKPTETAGDRIVRRKEGILAPIRKRVRLCADKRAAQEMLRKLIDAEERKAAGLVDYQSQTKQALGPMIDEFQKHLTAKGNSSEYVELSISRLMAVCDGCQFLRLVDLDAARAANWLFEKRQAVAFDLPRVKGLATTYAKIGEAFGEDARTIGYWRKQGAPIIPRGKNDLEAIRQWRIGYVSSRSMAAGTSNHYATALRGFGKWLVKHAKRIDTNPFENLDKIDARADVRKQRRVLDSEQFCELIAESTASERTYRDLFGVDRAMIYTLAAYTGLRASEIASLRTNSFEFGDSPTVVVEAAYTKNSRLATIPLRADLAAKLAQYLNNRTRFTLAINRKPELVWPGKWSKVGAEMIRIDLEAAGIPYTDDNGKDFDFHALRHQFITCLGKAGVSLKSAQELARHSKPELTANTYTHLSLKDTAADVERMPAIPTGQRQEARSTGTDPSLVQQWGQQVLESGGILSDKPSSAENPVYIQKTKKDPVKTEFTESFESSPGRT